MKSDIINPIDKNELKRKVREAKPYPSCCIDNFLNEDFANQVVESFPSFEEAQKFGKSFKAVNEKKKVQLTNSNQFAKPIAQLNEALASKSFTDLLSYVFNIPDLLPDDKLVGGGIHQTGAHGFLDVHIDFNYLQERKLYRRLNILIYFNKDWKKEWGGEIELWDKKVKNCDGCYLPIFNRCIIFETSNISYHGVSKVSCPPGITRKSFAAYYYTKEVPPYWEGKTHSTVFKARPNEKLKGYVLMPAEKLKRSVSDFYRKTKQNIKELIKGK